MDISTIVGPKDRAVAWIAAMLASSFKRVDNVFPGGGAAGDPAYRMAVILVASAPQNPGTIWPEQQSIDVKRLLEGSKDILLGRGFMCFLADGRDGQRIAPPMSRSGNMPAGTRCQASALDPASGDGRSIVWAFKEITKYL